MSTPCKKQSWQDSCVTAGRRKALRLPILRKNDFNLWLSEYQRHYQYPYPRKVPPTPGWVPIYEAQLRRKTGREQASGGGAFGSTGAKATTESRDSQNDDYSHHECYRNRRSCYAGLYQSQNEASQYPQQDGAAHAQETAASATQGQGQAAADDSYGGPVMHDIGSSSPWSSDPTGSDPNLQMRAIKEKKRQRSDSGLTNLSIALCLWKKNDPRCQRHFSLLPWQQQVAQTALEAREYAGLKTCRRIY